MKYEFWNARKKSDKPDWRWHLRGDNGEIMAQGEGFTTRAKCLASIDGVKMSGFAEVFPLGVSKKLERNAERNSKRKK